MAIHLSVHPGQKLGLGMQAASTQWYVAVCWQRGSRVTCEDLLRIPAAHSKATAVQQSEGPRLKILIGFVAWGGGGVAGGPAAARLQEALRERGVIREGGALWLRHLACNLAVLHADWQHRSSAPLCAEHHSGPASCKGSLDFRETGKPSHSLCGKMPTCHAGECVKMEFCHAERCSCRQ